MATPTVDFFSALSGLRAYWPLDQADPTNELVGGLDLTLLNTPTTGVDMGFTAGDTGITFDEASTEGASVAHNSAFDPGTNDWSIAFWCVIPTSNATTRYVIAHDGNGGTGTWEIRHTSGNLSGRFVGLSTNSAFTANASVKFLVYNMDRDGNMTKYIDGSALSGTTTISGDQTSQAASVTLYLGRRQTTGHGTVSMIHVALRAALWTTQEMTDAMAARLASADVDADAEHAAVTGVAYQVIGHPKPNAGLVSVTSQALGTAPNVKASAGHVTTTGAAHAPTASTSVAVNVGHAAIEAWASEGEGSDLDVNPGLVEIAGAAFDQTATVASPFDHAAASSAAQDLTVQTGAAPAAEHAAVAGAAGTPSASVTANVEHVATTGEAFAAEPSIGLGSPLASAQATALAYDVEAQVVEGTFVDAEHAAVTGDTYDAAVALELPAEHAPITGGAAGVAPVVAGAPPSIPVGGAAHAPTVAIQQDADHAAIGGAAYGVSASVASNVGHVPGTASALAVATAIAVYPEHAALIADAYPDQVRIAVSAGLVSIEGDAFGVEGSHPAGVIIPPGIITSWLKVGTLTGPARVPGRIGG